MSDVNPYQSSGLAGPQEVGAGEFNIRRVDVRPIELMKRAYALMGDQYMLMVGVTLVALLLGSLVPMGLIFGAMLVGVYLCFMQREQLGRTEFATLFKGFDFFVDSMIVMLIAVALSFVVMIPLYLLMFAGIAGVAVTGENNPETAMMLFMAIFALFMVLFFVAMAVIYMPLLFAFQLISDRHLTAMEAVRFSWRASMKNLWGILWHLFVVTAVTDLAAMACYIPAFFVLPISIGSMFVLYRDIFGPGAFPPPPLSPSYAPVPPPTQ